MSLSIFLFGQRSKVIALLNLLAARAQARGAVVFIDPAGLFDAEYVLDAEGTMAGISLSRPRSAYQLRALVDAKLPAAHAGEPPFLVIVSCVAGLFDPVDVSELNYVVDYTFDALLDLLDGRGTLVCAASDLSHSAARQVQARCSVSIDVERVGKSAEIFK